MGTANNLLNENMKTNLNNHNLGRQTLQRLLRHSLQTSAMRGHIKVTRFRYRSNERH
jgi:hypothetical protein